MDAFLKVLVVIYTKGCIMELFCVQSLCVVVDDMLVSVYKKSSQC